MAMEILSKVNKIKEGSRIIYNDGRLGHTDVSATVLVANRDEMVVQFEDRADTTTIRFSDHEWMKFIEIPV